MGAFKNPAIVFLLTIVVLFKSCQCSRSSNGVVRSIFFLAYKPLRLDFGYFKNGDFSEDNMVLIRSSKFGAKSLSKNFFRKTNVEFYCSLSEYRNITKKFWGNYALVLNKAVIFKIRKSATLILYQNFRIWRATSEKKEISFRFFFLSQNISWNIKFMKI